VVLNLVVVVANMGMPVASNLQVAGHAIGQSGGFYQLAGAETIGGWAGDALPLVAFGQRYLLSPGDMLLMVGVAALIASAMLGDSEATGTTTDSDEETLDLRN
jgi:hypothetical protein